VTNPELPTWPGAETVYSRVYNINIRRCAAAYHAWVKAGSKKPGWRVPDDLQDVIDALNDGNEEYLKAYAAQYPTLWDRVDPVNLWKEL